MTTPGDSPPEADLVLPLRPPPAFLTALGERWNLRPRQIDLIRCRAGQLTFKETARELSIRLSYAQRLQAMILRGIGRSGGHAALMLWIAQEYQLWRLGGY